MKKLLTAILVFIAMSTSAQTKRDTAITRTDSLNIKQLQQVIVFEGEIKKTFDSLIEIWYKQARQKGTPSDKSFIQTLDKIGATLDEFTK